MLPIEYVQLVKSYLKLLRIKQEDEYLDLNKIKEGVLQELSIVITLVCRLYL